MAAGAAWNDVPASLPEHMGTSTGGICEQSSYFPQILGLPAKLT